MQEMIACGILAPSFVVSYSHTDGDIDRTIEAVDSAAAIYARALDDGATQYLEGRPVKPVFRPFN
jgi:glutamate-1-semialdehyde 2,1-aminomutase